MDAWIARRWTALVERLRCTADASSALAELDACYSSPSRSYHRWSHVRACLGELHAVAAELDEPALVEAALWYHDAIYDPRSRSNEERSAALAAQTLARLGLDSARAARVAELVRATDHAKAAESGDAAYIQDIDLAILGAPEAEFTAYDRAIRMEYSHLDDESYRRGRLEVLAAFRDRERVFLTEHFRAARERRARSNLGEAIRRLEGAGRSRSLPD